MRAKVKPERDKLGPNPNNIPLKRRWWAYHAHRPELYAQISTLNRVLAIARVSATFAFALLPPKQIFNEKLVLFPFDTFASFATLQSRVHEVWARFFSSTLKDDLQYTPSDCFETFPLVSDWRTRQDLEAIGREYHETRSSHMQMRGIGLTELYNRFHNPDDHDGDVACLRQLHDAIDRGVLDAYGWGDIRPNCEFIPEFDDEDAENGRQSRKRYRYRWPDDIRDEVLARLLDLNRQKALEEGQLLAPPPESTMPSKKTNDNAKRKAPSELKAMDSLFPTEKGD